MSRARTARRSRLGGLRRLAPLALVPALLTGCTAFEGNDDGPSAGVDATEPGQAPATGNGNDGAGPGSPAGADDDAMAIPEIVDAVQPSVVTIFTEGGLGSGVIYTEDGLIITNEHVVRNNTEVEVAFADGQRVAGTVTAADRVSDLALVQADREDLPAARFQERLPEIGELAVVIGSPLGFENTVTSGIISGLHRQIPGSASRSQSLVDLIQTDAAISPGNSGGAVVNGQGEIIGISEAYIPPQAGAVSLGFAIPAPTATAIAEELLEDGTADHAYLGLTPGTITPQIARELGVEDTAGAVVISVARGGPADEAEIRPGDILTSLDGEELASPEDLLAALRRLDPGDTVSVGFRRGTGEQEAEIELAERAAEGF
ncbi:S1C family serine protease [Arthrobacter sp. TMN-37]